MAILKLKLSKRKEVNLDLGGFEKRFWVHYLVDIVNYVATVVFITLVFIQAFKENPSPVEFFKYIIGYLMTLLACVIIKVIIGGFKFWAESKFDIFALLTLIALISGLLIKQLFDLTTEGMLPSSGIWYMTIWGLLALFLLHYLFDLLNRNSRWLRSLLWGIPLLFEVVLAIKILLDWALNTEQAFFILTMLPLFFLLVGLAKNLRTKLLLAVNAFILSGIALFGLDVDFTAITLGVLVALEVFLFALYPLTPKRIGAVVHNFDGLKKLDKFAKKYGQELTQFGLILFILVVAIGMIVDLATGGKFIFARDTFQANIYVFKDVGKFHNWLIGSDFAYLGSTGFSILMKSYGLLGLGLVGFSFVSMFVIILRAVKKNLDLGRKNLMYINLAVLTYLFGIFVLSFFLYISAEIAIVMFVLLGIVAAEFAVATNNLLPASLIALGKKMDVKLKLGIRLAQLVGIALTIIATGYVALNVSDIFLK